MAKKKKKKEFKQWKLPLPLEWILGKGTKPHKDKSKVIPRKQKYKGIKEDE